jgi:RND family efflux transporter MFP subunit
MEAKAALSLASFNVTEAKHRLQRAQDSVTMGTLRDKLEVDVSAAKLEAARLALEMSRKDALACKIRSPSTGFVAAVGVAPGEVVDNSAELARVLQLDPIHLRLDYPQERIDEIAVGLSVEVVLDSSPKEKFQGAVIRISPVANSQLRVLPVVVELANPENRIKAGVSGFARVQVASKPAMVIPATAVIERGGQAVTFRVEDGRARIRQIQTGSLVKNGWVEVRGGLEAGSELVIFGTESLQDGDAVDVDWRKWARRD